MFISERKKKLLCLFALLLLALTIDIFRFLSTPITPKDTAVEFTLQSGTSITQLARELQQRGLITRPFYFTRLAKLKGVSRRLKAGDYRIEPQTTPVQLLNQFAQGRVIYQQVTFLEGWTFAQMLTALRQLSDITHTIDNQSPNTIMARLGHPMEHPEGRFFPDTYRYHKGTSDLVLLRAAYRAMEKHLDTEWKTRAPNLSYQTPYQALIAASLIEQEAQTSVDRPKISAVLQQRLKKNMRLQFDSTVIYGLGKARGYQLRLSDLRKDTPYNTYQRTGLPPTPIGIPSLSALRATLHPSEGTALYFVAKADGSREHQFSNNWVEHQTAVTTYKTNRKKLASLTANNPYYFVLKPHQFNACKLSFLSQNFVCKVISPFNLAAVAGKKVASMHR